MKRAKTGQEVLVQLCLITVQLNNNNYIIEELS